MIRQHSIRLAAAALSLTAATFAVADHEGKGKNVNLLKASDIIGMKVENNTGENLGDINELAINSESGRVRYGILSSGGVMGVGDKLYAIPLHAFRFTDHDSPARLDITKQRLQQAPDFNPEGWNTIGDERWGQTVHEYYGVKADFDGDVEPRRDRDPNIDPKRAGAKMTRGRFIKGSEVVGMNVENQKGEDLGEINDLMIDVNSSRTTYAVLGFGGVLGVNEKLFAVPWQSLDLKSADKSFVLAVDKDKLKNAPGFNKDRWPDMTDVKFSKNVHEFYGAEPNWIYGYAEGDEPAGSESGGWDHDDQYGKLFASGKMETVKGRVTAVDTITPMSGMAKGIALNLATDDGKTIAVHLGPEWFIKHQQVVFKNGDQVTVKGAQVTIDGKPCILAREVRRDDRVLIVRDKDGRPMWDAWHYRDKDSD